MGEEVSQVGAYTHIQAPESGTAALPLPKKSVWKGGRGDRRQTVACEVLAKQPEGRW